MHVVLHWGILVAQTVGLPTESQSLIIAVDRVLDMARTAVNLWSDLCGCAVVSRFEAIDSRDQQTPLGGENNRQV